MNKSKLKSVFENAKAVSKLRENMGVTFSEYLWKFCPSNERKASLLHAAGDCKSYRELPTTSIEGDLMASELKKHGFKFVGPTICHTFMCASGMINYHMVRRVGSVCVCVCVCVHFVPGVCKSVFVHNFLYSLCRNHVFDMMGMITMAQPSLPLTTD